MLVIARIRFGRIRGNLTKMSEDKKILYVITKSVWGGAQRYVFDLATNLSSYSLSGVEGLPKHIYRISVALGGNGILAAKLRASGIPVIPIENLDRDISLLKDFTVFISLYRLFRRERPDIVHLNSSKVGFFGALAGRLAGVKKIVFTAHGWPFNEDRSSLWKLFFYFTSWLTGLLATDIITLSDRELHQTKKLPFVFRKTHRIYNGIKNFETLPRAEALKYLAPELVGACLPVGMGLPKLIIGTISELHPNKGLEYTIRALASLVKKSPSVILSATEESLKIIFLIVGSGEAEPHLRALIKELNLENTVFLAGFIEDAKKYLSAFDIFTLTSLKEGLPYVVLEAGAAGLPIVASGVGGIPEILDHGRAGFLTEPKDTSGIAFALNLLIKDGIIRDRFSQNIKSRIKSVFNLDQMLAETKKVYE